MEILYRDLLQRSCQEVSYRDPVNRAAIEILYRDIARRPLIEILYRELVKRTEILLRDLFVENLNKDLTSRSLTEISCGDLL